MDNAFTMMPIAHIHTDFPEKFGIPRQSGLVDELEALIAFEPEYRNPDALRGIEGYSHLWLIWRFTEFENGEWSPTVRPPRLGGNKRVGVFATRSPNRPNPIGLSLVKLLSVEATAHDGCVLRVSGADILDGTPIYDIKPYLPYLESRKDASGGFTDTLDDYLLAVNISDEQLDVLSEKNRNALVKILEQDPRPSYHSDPDRVYGMDFAGHCIKFTVDGKTLTVIEIK